MLHSIGNLFCTTLNEENIILIPINGATTLSITGLYMAFSISAVTLSITMFCQYAECRIFFIIMLNVIMLSVIVLSVIVLNVVMLIVVVPNQVNHIRDFTSVIKNVGK